LVKQPMRINLIILTAEGIEKRGRTQRKNEKNAAKIILSL
jgi:hypothetical protein